MWITQEAYFSGYHQFYARVDVGNNPTNDSDSLYQPCYNIDGEFMFTYFRNCVQPLTGRYVQLQGQPNSGPIITGNFILCEVQIYGYLYRGKAHVEKYHIKD